ncbi:MAG: tetratricopeptide repeat protein [Acidobacteriota bacterium]|nr:tetratricopeptide repeat protein [Acidobacteriota bacterium]
MASSVHPKQMVKRSKGEKAPARKATPSKSPAVASSASAPKSARSAKSSKAKAPVKASNTRSRSVSPSKSKTSVTRQVAKQPVKTAPAKKGAPTSKPPSKSQPATTLPTQSKATSTPLAASRPPTRDEAAAMRAFERAHKEFTRGHFSEARMLFRALIELPGGASEVTARARTYLAIAESRLQTQGAPPRDAEALYDRGVIELNRGDYVAAQEMFERALKRDAEAADVHYALAATRARLGSIDLALKSLERALNIKRALRVRAQHDPDLAPLRNEPDYERLIFASRS